jgi:basic membrane protein A and related proteins
VCARRVLVTAALLALPHTGCAGDDTRSERRPDRGLTVGFLFVGSTHDRGYNEAAFAGSRAIRRAFPDAKLIEREHVPESQAAEDVMEDMIERGARIIFPTSFGHLEPALNVAARHPEVTFLHEGGLETAENLGTYFGTIWEAQYAAGQAAGLATRTGRLGFVAAFPIAQSLLSINAYQRGARSVNPNVRTEVIFTSRWCAPRKQRAAARELLAHGADVLAQHQDCTRPVIEEAARAGAKTTGYHFDAAAIAPGAWLTGSVWNWGPLYVKMVRTVLRGEFARSPYAGRYRAGAAEGAVSLAGFGHAATPPIRARVRKTFERIRSGELRPFDGPVRDQRGNLRIAGRQPDITELEETNYLAEGIIGEIPGG